jgi:hypothetical protein
MKTKMKTMIPRAGVGLLILVLTLVFQFFGHATEFAEPKSESIASANGKYTLITDPKTKVHKVYSNDDLKTPLWSFELEIWHFPIYLANDGKSVCHLAWRHVKEDELKQDCVTFRNAKGVFKSYPFSKICADPPKTQDVGMGPIGNFWRTWYREAKSDSETVTVKTTRDKTFIFSIKNGSIVKE